MHVYSSVRMLFAKGLEGVFAGHHSQQQNQQRLCENQPYETVRRV